MSTALSDLGAWAERLLEEQGCSGVVPRELEATLKWPGERGERGLWADPLLEHLVSTAIFSVWLRSLSGSASSARTDMY